jgi:hypothetical protein
MPSKTLKYPAMPCNTILIPYIYSRILPYSKVPCYTFKLNGFSKFVFWCIHTHKHSKVNPWTPLDPPWIRIWPSMVPPWMQVNLIYINIIVVKRNSLILHFIKKLNLTVFFRIQTVHFLTELPKYLQNIFNIIDDGLILFTFLFTKSQNH